MHRFVSCVHGVAVSFDHERQDICRHTVGELSLEASFQAVTAAWMGLQWALEHEALEAFSVVLAAYMSTAPRLGKGPTSVAEKLGRTCVHGDL